MVPPRAETVKWRLGRLRWSPRVDVALALMCCALAEIEIAVSGPDPVRVLCAGLATLPIAIRQRAPLVAAIPATASWAAFHLWNGDAAMPLFFSRRFP